MNLMTNETWWEFQEGCAYHRDSTAPHGHGCEDCGARLWVDEDLREPVKSPPYVSSHLRHACQYRGALNVCAEYYCPRLCKLTKPILEIPGA